LKVIKSVSLKGFCSAVSDHVPALQGTHFSTMLGSCSIGDVDGARQRPALSEAAFD
jgi:hypothetical protein